MSEIKMYNANETFNGSMEDLRRIEENINKNCWTEELVPDITEYRKVRRLYLSKIYEELGLPWFDWQIDSYWEKDEDGNVEFHSCGDRGYDNVTLIGFDLAHDFWDKV